MNLKEKFFDFFDLYVEKKTQKKDISKILKRLLPYKTGFDLIRLGNDNDGGYLVPDDLSNISRNYSAGVGDLTKFEEDLEEKYSIPSSMVDFNDVDPKLLPKKSKFLKKKIGISSYEENLSINDWLDNESGEIILKMDIEGDEYLTLSSMSDKNLKKIRILVIEIHDLRHLRNYSFFKTFEKVLLKLNNFFYVCHLHINNVSKVKDIGGYSVPDMLEVTLIRKNRVKNFTNQFASIPHKLDQKTVLKQKEIFLDKKWYL
jgi:hypothetical protein